MTGLRDFFLEQLTRDKWGAIRAHRVNNAKKGASATFVTAQRDRKQIEIVIWPEQDSQIVMTVADAL
jgi:hypothetical protein